MSDKIKCSIDFDDEWIQEDCHWKLKRLVYFTFTTDAANPHFYYSLLKNNPSEVQIDNKDIVKKGNTYTYVLDLSNHLSDILESPENYLTDDWLTVSATCAVDGLPEFFSKDYYLKVAPREISQLDIKLEYVTERPGEVCCSWMEYWENTEEKYLKGSSVEMFHRPAGESEFVKVGFLKWDEKKFEDDPYYHYIIKDTELENSTNEYINNCTIAEDETVYMNLLPGSELYLGQSDFFSFNFNPKELGIKPGDEYEFRIYPYNVYCSHFTHDEDENICGTDISALLTNDGTLSSIRKVPKGIVRVKVGEDWKEGQVWVMKDGQWKEAEAVYVMNEGTWKEAK